MSRAFTNHRISLWRYVRLGAHIYTGELFASRSIGTSLGFGVKTLPKTAQNTGTEPAKGKRRKIGRKRRQGE